MREINNQWFFTEPPLLFKLLTFYIKGDLIILLLLIIFILALGFFNLKFMLLILGIYIAIRHLGEMIYWFSHQFNERNYRPYDFGFKNLDNHAIYILMQTLSIAGVVFGLSLVSFSLLYLM